MISKLELSHLLETAFLPIKCSCTFDSEEAMTVRLINPRTGDVDMTVSDIATAPLNSSRAIADLIAMLKKDYGQLRIALPERRRYPR